MTMSTDTKSTPETATAASPADHSQDVSINSKPPFFRSTLFQILTVGLCAFCAPGIWSAMNGLGVGGSQSPNLVNAANALLYAFMTVTCFLGPFMTNLIGFRYTLSLGSIGYPLYAAGFVEGAIATKYPEDRKRGRYIATWFTFRNFGNIIGGAISLGINVKLNEQGQVGYQTYLGFIAIQCLGLLFGLMLSDPEKVIRNDGTKIATTHQEAIHWTIELKALWTRGKSKPILLLNPLFWYFGWVQAYPGTCLATYFTVRSRALGSFLSTIVGTFATWLGGSLVDIHWTSNRKLRAMTTWTLITLLNSITWIWAVIIQNEYRKANPILDWADQSTFGRGFGLYLFERASLGTVENYIYWCIGNLSSSPGEQIRYSSLLRGIETAGVTVGFSVQAVPVDLIVSAGINCGLWFFAMPCSFWATRLVCRRFEEGGI
ncbi:uncharacterized protein BDV14DRAFT_188278 [Aspergillus stella-maris]|uniref:uncharacterized protein n=1 Tax=Aspergillus stella-maris TaxID=1810926 RepID=UPI003CCDF73F